MLQYIELINNHIQQENQEISQNLQCLEYQYIESHPFQKQIQAYQSQMHKTNQTLQIGGHMFQIKANKYFDQTLGRNHPQSFKEDIKDSTKNKRLRYQKNTLDSSICGKSSQKYEENTIKKRSKKKRRQVITNKYFAETNSQLNIMPKLERIIDNHSCDQRQDSLRQICGKDTLLQIKVTQIILNQLNQQLDQLSIIDEIELEQFRLEVKRMDEAKSLKSISSSLDSDMQIETFEHSRRSQDSFFTSEEKVDQRSSLETQETSMLELFNSFIQKGQNQESTCETSIQSSPNREFEDNIMQKDHIPMQNRADKVEQIPIQQQPSPLIRIKLFQNVDQNTIQSKQIQTNQKDIIQQPNIKLVKKSSKKKAQVSPPKFQFVKYTKAKQQNLNVIIEDEEDSDIEVISFEDFKVSQRDSTQPDKRNSLSNSTSSKSFSESIKSQSSER